MLWLDVGLLSNSSLILCKQAEPLSPELKEEFNCAAVDIITSSPHSARTITRCRPLCSQKHLHHASLMRAFTFRRTPPLNSSLQDNLHSSRFCWNSILKYLFKCESISQLWVSNWRKPSKKKWNKVKFWPIGMPDFISWSGREAVEWGGVDWRGEWSDQRDWGLREAADHLRESLLLLICNPSQPGHFGGCQLHSAPLWTRLLYCRWSTWLCALGRVRRTYIATVLKTTFHRRMKRKVWG